MCVKIIVAQYITNDTTLGSLINQMFAERYRIFVHVCSYAGLTAKTEKIPTAPELILKSVHDVRRQ